MTQGSIGARIGMLVIATSAIQLANGFFGTLIGLRVALEGFDGTMAGLVLSSYFAGFTASAFFCGRIIQQYGHIRVYAAFGGMVSQLPLPCRFWSSRWPGSSCARSLASVALGSS